MVGSALKLTAIGLFACGGLAKIGWGLVGTPHPAQVQSVETVSVAAGGVQVVAIDGDLRGHFTVHPTVEGRRVTMLVDTGASVVALTHEDAEQAGITVRPTDFRTRISTANGTVMAAQVRLSEVRLGGIVVRGVDATVMPRGALGISLLGMSFLRRLGSFEIQRGTLVLRG